jgi:hypothetical protein
MANTYDPFSEDGAFGLSLRLLMPLSWLPLQPRAKAANSAILSKGKLSHFMIGFLSQVRNEKEPATGSGRLQNLSG